MYRSEETACFKTLFFFWCFVGPSPLLNRKYFSWKSGVDWKQLVAFYPTFIFFIEQFFLSIEPKETIKKNKTKNSKLKFLPEIAAFLEAEITVHLRFVVHTKWF